MSFVIVRETPRLRLRSVTADDAAFYLELVNDPSWVANIGDRKLHTVEAARAALETGAIAQFREHAYSLYMIERRSDGATIGMCGLVRRTSLPGPDIGYALRPPYWGQGYAYEAAAAVMEHAEHVLGLATVYGITAPHNQVSINLLNKLGLRYERYSRLPPDGKDTNIYRRDFRRHG
ncbi:MULTISPECIES: GNAT family N-acetyltransferase [unclassified Janthinobacterium]|uniref:GNAT family N-acetyltransferase n=1 Tax=unclassified Janthinobacterium TaxID=2610881 RepID=UPI001613B933|nr:MULTISPECIES: GNAT family N-acetyltransferase [unclassified Janthinobacterium]MBB5607943.1 RimJ/RimL family protein N-acetyltransferase [Janthinobacterium sp. S3T4]MBB5613316.1 RimJ/RimL family protein N-acetyltransferase [Janthinobacterium sp. S3M3]